ncbi:MAG: HAMP domain-containing sensor histidine kinase [Pseudomonadota bacterium]
MGNKLLARMAVTKPTEISQKNSSVMLSLLTAIVTITILSLVIFGIRDLRIAIANQTISARIDMEAQLDSAIESVRSLTASAMAQLRNEVETYFLNTQANRACAVTFGCPEFASGLIANASVYLRDGRPAAGEMSSLGDQILTLGDNHDYQSLAASLSGENPAQWANSKPGTELRPYCWLSHKLQVICIAVNVPAMANQVIADFIVATGKSNEISFTSDLVAHVMTREEISKNTTRSRSVTRALPQPFEHSLLRANRTDVISPTPYWLYSGIVALVLGASVSGFATAAFVVHRNSINEVRARLINMASTSHSLRTPLANLTLYANLLRRKNSEPATVEKYALIIDNEANRLKAVIDNVLEIGRIGTANTPSVTEEIPDELVQQIMTTFGAQTQKFRLALDSSTRVRFDTEGYKQILVNLIDNSLKHAADCPVDVKTWIDAKQIFIQVSDHGTGAPSAKPPITIGAYQRGDNAVGEGYGLGLVACKLIAERNGGSITLTADAKGFHAVASLNYETARVAI